jgi:hypothetical protein
MRARTALAEATGAWTAWRAPIAQRTAGAPAAAGAATRTISLPEVFAFVRSGSGMIEGLKF